MILSTKDFLPYEYFTKKNLEKENEDNKGVKLLLVLVLILFPFTIKALLSEKKEISVEEVKINESKNEIENIISWLQIYDEGITGDIKGNIGNFKIDNKNILNEINKDKELKIMFFEKIEDGGYTIRVQKE